MKSLPPISPFSTENLCFHLGDYSFGFQAQEQDEEMWGGSVTYKYRVEDPRLGRFFSVDPLSAKYPYYSAYQFSGNRLIDMVELEGLEPARSGSYNGDFEIAVDNVQSGNYGWTWNDCEWIRGEHTDYRNGNAWQDSKDHDLSSQYYPDQEINDWHNCSDELNVGESCHLFAFSGAFRNGIMGGSDEAEAEALQLFNHFCKGGPGDYTTPLYFGIESQIASILKDDDSFVSLTNQFAAKANEYLAKNGTLNGFEGNRTLNELRWKDGNSYMKDTYFMHAIMGGFCQVDISIVSVDNGKVALSVTIYDHFGAGRNDANVLTPGLCSMYYLQHNTPNDDYYKPFVWAVKVQ